MTTPTALTYLTARQDLALRRATEAPSVGGNLVDANISWDGKSDAYTVSVTLEYRVTLSKSESAGLIAVLNEASLGR